MPSYRRTPISTVVVARYRDTGELLICRRASKNWITGQARIDGSWGADAFWLNAIMPVNAGNTWFAVTQYRHTGECRNPAVAVALQTSI